MVGSEHHVAGKASPMEVSFYNIIRIAHACIIKVSTSNIEPTYTIKMRHFRAYTSLGYAKS